MGTLTRDVEAPPARPATADTAGTGGATASRPMATTPRTAIRPRSIAFWSALVAAPVAIGSGLGGLLGSRRAGMIAGGLTAAGLAALRWQLSRLFTPEPDHEVEEALGRLEIRRYAPRIEARTTIDVADFDAALGQGFARLADYIGGANRGHEELAMTTPVVARGSLAGERLGRTGGPVITSHRGGYTVAFVMPPDRTMDSLPRPSDERVRLHHVPERRVAALRFAGRYDGPTVAEREHELARLVAQHGLRAVGEPMFAGFDPPWTLPLLRRNEVWLELAR